MDNINRSALQEQLNMLTAKMSNPDAYSWQDITNFRAKELGVEENPCTIRKGAKLLYEYLQNGYELKPIRDQRVKTTILSISDLHCPYQLDASLLSQYKGKIDILQINGDIQDMQSVSKFPKMFRVNPIQEMIQCRQYLIDTIRTVAPRKVIINYGNHDLRLGAFLCNRLDCELQELLPKTSLDYLLEDGFHHYNRETGVKSNYSPITEVLSETKIEYVNNWYSRIGDVIFAHPSAYTSRPLGTAHKAIDYFLKEGIGNGDGIGLRCIVMAHTHKLARSLTNNMDVIEQGAFCHTEKMTYHDGKLIPSQKKGYVLLYLDKNDRYIKDLTKLVSID